VSKGSRNRTADRTRYGENYDAIHRGRKKKPRVLDETLGNIAGFLAGQKRRLNPPPEK